MQFTLDNISDVLKIVSLVALIFPISSVLLQALVRVLTSYLKKEANVRLVVTKKDGRRLEIELKPDDEASIRDALTRLKTEGVLESQAQIRKAQAQGSSQESPGPVAERY